MTDPSQQHIQDLATACVASVHATTGLRLDITSDTLPILDHYAHTVLEGDAENLLSLTAPMCGAYYGVVVRRRFEGFQWHAPKGEFEEWRLEFEPAFLHFNPIGVALDVITRKDAGWHAHLSVLDEDREEVERSVGLFGTARAEDFYSFSLRLEVLEQTLEALGRCNAQRAHAQTYDHQAYIRAIATRSN